jgi:ABC-type lipoprotein export system ATPase subunit
MKLTELQVDNFCKITALNIALGGHVTEISGSNGAGKSSTLNSIWVLLKGKKVAPAEPIRKGAERCRIRGRIGEYMVTRTFKRTKTDELTTELRIERGNESMPPTEAFMRSLIGDHMLDPGDFINLSSDQKFDVFRSFVPSVDFKLITNQNRQDYDRRTDVNRQAKEARAAAHMISVPEGTPTAQIDRAQLIVELQEAGDANALTERRRANREKVVAQIAQLKATHSSANERFEVYATERQATCKVRLDELLAEMERIKAAIEATERAEREEILERSRVIAVEAVNALDEADGLQAKLDEAGPLPEPADTQAIAMKIREADAANENVVKLQTREKHEKTADSYDDESVEITARMEAREKAKQDAIAAAQLPVAGITFGDGEVFLDGVPFDQASTAQKFRVGVAIAVAKNPTLRLVWVRDASLLDDKTYEQITKLAQEFDAQILLETVRAIGKDAIVLEDGHVKGAKAKE